MNQLKTNMNKLKVKSSLFFLLVFMFLHACQLSSTQEKNLNTACNRYLAAREKCMFLSIVASTQADFVKYYKEKGDTIFLQKFDCQESVNVFTIADPTLKEIKKHNEQIHVLYECKFLNYGIEEKDSTFDFVAISSNNGESWFFTELQDYKDKQIAKNFQRLIKFQ